MITVHPVPEYDDILHVSSNLRKVDADEIFATRWNDDPAELAAGAHKINGCSWLAKLDGVPVSVWGGVPMWPNVWAIYAYGTDDWPRVVLTMTKHIKRTMIPAIVGANAIRVSCATHAQHHEAHRWLEFLGGRIEHPEGHENFGKNGERFFTFIFDPKTILDEIALPRRSRQCVVAPQ